MRTARTATLSTVLALLMALAALAAPQPAASAPSRLLYAEPLQSAWDERPRAHSAGTEDAPRTLRFRAFGRAFALELAPNSRLTPTADTRQIYAGTLRDAPGSWARITRQGDALIGLFFDGSEHYAIEPARDVLAVLEPDVAVPASGNVIYRLADLMLDPALFHCEAVLPSQGSHDAATALARLAAERPWASALAGSATHRVRLDPVADFAFAERFGSNAETEVLARLNVAEGIFNTQAGIDISAGTPTVFRALAGDYPFTATTPSTLLEQISDYREAQNGQSAGFGLTHLFTNKTFDGGVGGIAWQGTVCLAREGAGLSTSAGLTRNASALVAAHEIGHNLGAPHDGGSGSSSCPSTTPSYLMAPFLNGSSTLSACSLERIASTIATLADAYPACLVPLSDYDVALEASATLRVEPAASVELPLTVENLGTESATGVNLSVTVPAGITIEGVTHTDGFCDYGPSTSSCDLATLVPGAVWSVTLTLQSDATGRYDIDADITADTDRDAGNDSRIVRLTVGNPAPAGGGGGGSLGVGVLALLAVARACRRPSAQRDADRLTGK